MQEHMFIMSLCSLDSHIFKVCTYFILPRKEDPYIHNMLDAIRDF